MVVGIILNLVFLAFAIYMIYNHFTWFEKDQKKRAIQKEEATRQFVEEADYEIRKAKQNYHEALGSIVVPVNAATIDVETSVFGASYSAKSIMGEKLYKYNFYFWQDRDNLYIFPTAKHLSPENMSSIGRNSFKPYDIRLITIPINCIVYYALIGEKETKILDGESNKPNLKGAVLGAAVGGESGALIGAMMPNKRNNPVVLRVCF